MPRPMILICAVLALVLGNAPDARARPLAAAGPALASTHAAAAFAAKKKVRKNNNKGKKGVVRKNNNNNKKPVPLARLVNTRTKESGGAPLPKDDPIAAARAQQAVDDDAGKTTDLQERVRAYRAAVGADPRLLPRAQTPLTLHEAALAGDEARVSAILDHAEDAKKEANSRDAAGRTPLHWAAAAGHKAVVARLIDFGADVNAVDPIGKGTALHYAAEFNHVELVEFLLEHKADATLKDARNHTPLDVAEKQKNDAIAAMLRAHLKYSSDAK